MQVSRESLNNALCLLAFLWATAITMFSAQAVCFARAASSIEGEGAGQKTSSAQAAIERTRRLVDEIRAASYAELGDASIEIKTFRSRSDYFRASFSFGRFFTGRKMRCVILVNPEAFNLKAPEAGARAILAHELGHALYFTARKRIRLVGLIRLSSKNFTARFERWADLQAISRGYGEGLKQYREWLYQNIPPERLAEKRRNYFSPEEIDAIETALKKKPDLLNYWLKRVPRSLSEINSKQ
jgi:hypothetical protein